MKVGQVTHTCVFTGELWLVNIISILSAFKYVSIVLEA